MIFTLYVSTSDIKVATKCRDQQAKTRNSKYSAKYSAVSAHISSVASADFWHIIIDFQRWETVQSVLGVMQPNFIRSSVSLRNFN